MRGKTLRLVVPFAVLLIGGVFSAWLWSASTERITQNYQRLLSGSARIHAGLFASDIDGLERGLARISRHWMVAGGTSPEIWREEAETLAETYPAIARVQRLDADLHMRWQVAGAVEGFQFDLPIDVSPAERDRILAIRDSNTFAVSDVSSAKSGDPHIVIYAPLRAGNRHDGFMAVDLNLMDVFTDLVRKTNSSNRLEVGYGDRTLLTLGGEDGSTTAPGLAGVAVTGIGDLAFDIRMLPTERLLRANGAGVPAFLLTISLFITLLATFLAYFITHTIQRGKDLRSSFMQISDQERRYSELLRRANLGFVITSPDGTFVECNEPYLRMMGCTNKDQLIGRPISEYLFSGGMELRNTHVANIMRTAGVVHRHLAMRQRGGGHVLISASAIADITHDGQTRFISLVEDITESNRIQHEIIESKRIYEEVFEGSDIAITDVDLAALFTRLQELRRHGVRDLRQYIDGGPKRLEELCRLVRLNAMNQAGLRLFGGESLEQLRTMDYFLESDRPAQIREIALGIWDGMAGLRKEVNYTSFTHRNITVIYSLRLPASVEEAHRVPVVTMDVTDMRSAEMARQANAAKTQFLASMSHEIRTPLNGVIGNLELLAQTGLQQDQEDLLFDAEKAAKSLLALIGNILDFSKIEAGKLTVEQVDLNPALIVQESVDIVQSRARQKGIYVTGFMSQDLPQTVRGDPTRIRQILLNLLGNAVKFTGQGGVHVSLTVQDPSETSCSLLFQVHDSGRGFSQDVADALFQPFIQNHKQSFQDFGGTGLGLSICKSLVETFGGKIGCESTPHQGASFWFTVPVEIIKPAGEAPPLPDLSQRRVMFVLPDNGDPPAALQSYLRQRGATFVTVGSDAAALSLNRQAVANEQGIDLCIYVAPPAQWPGIGFAAALRDNRTIPIVCAPDTLPVTWRRALRSGAGYLLTPEIAAESLDRNIHLIFGENTANPDRSSNDNLMTMDIAALENKRVLVLEDRLVNQTIIQRQLKKLRMQCTIAGDGVIGLQRMMSGTYDLILCDCSMPEMNGYEFTRLVRQRERESGGVAHIPIIAMTANAFREDMEKCFASGMDDFISKPVTLHRLSSVLSQWIPKSQTTRQEATRQESTRQMEDPMAPASADMHALNLHPHIAAVDLPVLHRLLGSTDESVVKDIIAEFLPAAKESWQEVQRSIAGRDAESLRMGAHGAKGEARNMGAMALGRLYEKLEVAAKSGDLDSAETVMKEIPSELQRVQDFIDDFIIKAAQ